ncbi:MAG: hypothetical protein ACI8X5_001097 [Planctomycetota bacterium]|jgi:hypothetical protein
MRLSTAKLATFALCLASSAAPALGFQFAEPFEPGLRWIHAESLTSPAIPTRVSFAAGGELVWVGTEVANKRLHLFAGPNFGVTDPVLTDVSVSGASYILDVKAGREADQLFALVQFPEPDEASRRTTVMRHDALAPASGAIFDDEWTYSFSFVANGLALMDVADQGQVVAVAVVQSSARFVRVLHLDGPSGAPLMTYDMQSVLGLGALALSGDGKVTAVCAESRLILLDQWGGLLHDEALSGPASTLALSQDGSRLIVGLVGSLLVYDFDGSAYQLVHTHTGGTNEAVKQVAVSDDGQTYAGTWYRFLSVDQTRFEVYGGATHTMLNQVLQQGSAGNFQNAPVAVEMTADGRRIAFASWGQGTDLPEVVLVERGVSEPLLEVDLPGSAMGIDLDPSGTQIALVAKNLHANQLGTTGEVRLYSTGERDLELKSPVRVGGDLEVASIKPGAKLALFLVGQRAKSPIAMPGMLGELHLARNNGLHVYGRVTDLNGRADLSVPVPAQSTMIGFELAVQVANRVSGQIVFSDTVLDPLIF